MDDASPLISIITATLNAAGPLARTAASVAAQRRASFEWIVVDGGSTDGTLPLLQRQTQPVTRYVSEPDTGIYDAWNKGCGLARGAWLLFLGAGDELAASDTLAALSRHLAEAHPAHDLVYGKLQYVSPDGRRALEEAGVPWPELEGRWELGRPALPPHPATFHHRSLFSGGRRFDTRFRLAGDSHFLLRHAMSKAPLFVPVLVCRAPVGGMSLNLQTAVAVVREVRDINRELSLVPPLRHRLAESLLLGAKAVVSRLPAPIGRRVADGYRRLTGRPGRWSAR